MKIGKALREKGIFVMLMVFTLVTMLYFGSRKEGYHVDEVYSYGLANSEYLPFMHFGVQDYSVKDWMLEYGSGESLVDLFRNLWKDFRILKSCDFQWKESVIYRDYLTAQAASADTRSTTWLSGQDYLDYIAVSQTNAFNYASVYYNQRGDVHPPLYYMILHTMCSFFEGFFRHGLASVSIWRFCFLRWWCYTEWSGRIWAEKCWHWRLQQPTGCPAAC